MTENQKEDSDISKQEFDLSEEEMQRIFFGSDATAPKAPAAPNSSIKPKKLERKNKPDIESVISPSIDNIEETECENESEEPEEKESKKSIRPQGRPKIWTPEKIAQKKLEAAKLNEQKRNERLERIRTSKLSIQQPLSDRDREKIIETTIESKDNVEKHITQKKQQLRNAQKSKNIEFVRQRDKCDNHLFKFQHFDNYGNVVVACSRCSAQDQLTTAAWNSYLIKHRGQI
jgi:hypothetical protein